MQEADGHRLDALAARPPGQPADLGVVERAVHRPVREHALADLPAQAARDQGTRGRHGDPEEHELQGAGAVEGVEEDVGAADADAVLDVVLDVKDDVELEEGGGRCGQPADEEHGAPNAHVERAPQRHHQHDQRDAGHAVDEDRLIQGRVVVGDEVLVHPQPRRKRRRGGRGEDGAGSQREQEQPAGGGRRRRPAV